MHILLIKQINEISWSMETDKTSAIIFFLRKNNPTINIADLISFLGQGL
jgi:hypothetical protein